MLILISNLSYIFHLLFSVHINTDHVTDGATTFVKSYDNILEPKLDELVSQLRKLGGLLDQRLTHRLSSLSSPDELFNIFSELHGELFSA